MSRFSFLKQRLFSALRLRMLGSHAEGVIYRTANGLLAAPLEDVSVGKALGFKGGYDTRQITELQKLISPGDTIYVIGTHIGALLIPLAASCKEVIGYEANPATFSYVIMNIHLNKATNVRVFNLAVGDSSRKIEFYQNRSNSGGSKIKPQKDQHYYTYDSPKTIEVSMVSLDQHRREQHLSSANGIVMDIEGAEFFALKGMRETLSGSRFLYIEYVPHHLENVSGSTNKEFFEMILPHFNTVRFTNHQIEAIDLKKNAEQFLGTVDNFRRSGESDDLLFVK